MTLKEMDVKVQSDEYSHDSEGGRSFMQDLEATFLSIKGFTKVRAARAAEHAWDECHAYGYGEVMREADGIAYIFTGE